MGGDKIRISKRTPLEKLGLLIDSYKSKYPSNTIVLFLDYVQIIDHSLRQTEWEAIKEVSYTLEALAIEKEVIVVVGSQVNDKRQTREGRDVYNAATTVLDLMNHSHSALKSNSELKPHFKEKVGGKSICTLSAFKQKHGESF